jgi:hypothetical protein
MSGWRGGAVAHLRRMLVVGALTALAGCPQAGTPNAPGPTRGDDAAVFQACDSVCVRPADCVHTFNDDGICPPGFLCVLRFSGCSRD